MDLGASPLGALRRVILPMLMPAIFASTVLVFADVIDDFVIVRYLSGDSSTEPVSVKIYNTARAAPTPGAQRAGHPAAAGRAGRRRRRLPGLPLVTRGDATADRRHRRLRRRGLSRHCAPSRAAGATAARMLTVCSISTVRHPCPPTTSPRRWRRSASSRMLPREAYVDPAVFDVGAAATSSPAGCASATPPTWPSRARSARSAPAPTACCSYAATRTAAARVRERLPAPRPRAAAVRRRRPSAAASSARTTRGPTGSTASLRNAPQLQRRRGLRPGRVRAGPSCGSTSGTAGSSSTRPATADDFAEHIAGLEDDRRAATDPEYLVTVATAHLRRRGQLEGHRRELPGVLPLLDDPPRAVPDQPADQRREPRPRTGDWVGGWMDLRDGARRCRSTGSSGGVAIARLDEHELRTSCTSRSSPTCWSACTPTT